MIFSGVTNYLRWVFPVVLDDNEGIVSFDSKEYDHERALIIDLCSKYSYLPEEYFGERGFNRVWDVVKSIADDDQFCIELYSVCAGIAFTKGFLNRFDRVIIADEAVASRFYWLSGAGGHLEFVMAFYEFTPDQFKEIYWGGAMKSLIEQFHDKKREDFIKRFEQINPDKAALLRECQSEKEVELLLKEDSEFIQKFRARLFEQGKHALVDKLFSKDLGL